MQGLQLLIARLAGLVGIAVAVVAVAARALGHFWIGGLQSGTLLLAGMAAMLVGCLAYLAVLVEGRAR